MRQSVKFLPGLIEIKYLWRALQQYLVVVLPHSFRLRV